MTVTRIQIFHNSLCTAVFNTATGVEGKVRSITKFYCLAYMLIKYTKSIGIHVCLLITSALNQHL